MGFPPMISKAALLIFTRRSPSTSFCPLLHQVRNWARMVRWRLSSQALSITMFRESGARSCFETDQVRQEPSRKSVTTRKAKCTNARRKAGCTRGHCSGCHRGFEPSGLALPREVVESCDGLFPDRELHSSSVLIIVIFGLASIRRSFDFQPGTGLVRTAVSSVADLQAGSRSC